MGTNKNVVVSFSIAILLLLSLLLLLTYNSKCNQSHNTAGPAMQNSYNVGNYSKGPEPFYFEKFTQNEPFAQEEQEQFTGQLTSAQIDEYKNAPYSKQIQLEKYYRKQLKLDTTIAQWPTLHQFKLPTKFPLNGLREPTSKPKTPL